jgi:pantothenate kinase
MKNQLKKNCQKKDHLINSAVAAITFQENLKRKLSIKKNYYKHKIKILREIRDL